MIPAYRILAYNAICPGCMGTFPYEAVPGAQPNGWKKVNGRWVCTACAEGPGDVDNGRSLCRCPMLVGGGIDHAKGCSRL